MTLPDGENPNPGTSGGDPPVAPVTTPVPPVEAPQNITTKDGKMFMGDREVVYAADLIASKKGLEGKLAETQTAHDTALTGVRQELSTSQAEVTQLTAKLETAEKAGVTGATNEAEVARLKGELETATTAKTTAETKVTDLRKEHITSAYKVPAEQLVDKTPAELDALELALKTVTTAGGPGAYALTGGGGQSPAPQTPMDRAKAILDNTPVRGVRNAPPAQ